VAKILYVNALGRVDGEIAERDEDDYGEGVEVGEDVVGRTVYCQCGGLGDEVVVDLVVGEPCEVAVVVSRGITQT
jgi:hypothetical protein